MRVRKAFLISGLVTLVILLAALFGWETLAVRVFELTSEGEWERAALPAIAIVGVGLIPVALLTRGSEHLARA